MAYIEVAAVEDLSPRRNLFLRYFTLILIDLVVLNLFDEHSQYVIVESFTVSLAVAVFLQVLLKLTLKLEYAVADYFSSQSWRASRFLRVIGTILILFGSKFVILGLINVTFGDQVVFAGPINGVIAFIAVIATMLVAEKLVIRFCRRSAVFA
ncbi:hypothetical protein R50073_09390 [Maricurvus nonylphenolicus]|uniref:hypothetical protein n=1 Tax=Maricurvus nonylphenolicus TaxID=1008307 RepID=UPI0036F3F2DD